MKIVKGLVGKTYEEQMKLLGMFCLERRRLRGDLMAVSDFLIRGTERGSANLCSLVTVIELEGTAWGRNRESSG